MITKKNIITLFIYLNIFFSCSFILAQNKILNEIKSYNEEGNFLKAFKQITKYKDKKEDTVNINYLICLSDYYCISNNTQYNPYKAISIINNVSCEKITAEHLGIYFKNNQECTRIIIEKKTSMLVCILKPYINRMI